MEEVLYVLGVVEGGGGSGPLGNLLLVARFARVDAYKFVNMDPKTLRALDIPLKIHSLRKSGSDI